jgi:NADH:ubiquinone oxidoreductase subunit 3 (subunit A)
MPDFSEQELELIRLYRGEKEEQKIDILQEKRVYHQTRSRRKFYIFITVLIVLPFIIAGGFVYDVSKINNTLNISGFNQLKSSLSSKSYHTLSNQAGLKPVASAASTYDHRFAIVGIIFVVFILIVLSAVIVRLLVNHSRKASVQ